MGTPISRRELLAAARPALVCAGLSAALPFGLQGCGVPSGQELDQRIVDTLRLLVTGPRGSRSAVASVDMTEAQALQELRADLSEIHLHALTMSRYFMRAFVEARIDGDLREGNTRYVSGWLLTETEVATLVLLGY